MARQALIYVLRSYKTVGLKAIPLVAFALFLLISSPPQGLTPQGWHIFILFATMLLGVIIRILPTEYTTIIALVVGLLTKTISLAALTYGITNQTPWIVLFAFILSEAVIKTKLGNVLAFFLLSFAGSNKYTTLYSMAWLSFFIAPFLPSNSARCAGIIIPIADAVTASYAKEDGFVKNRFGSFLNLMTFHADNIACATFLTGVSVNLIIVSTCNSLYPGTQLNFLTWAKITIIPAIVTLAVLPILTMMLLPIHKIPNNNITLEAKEKLKNLMPLTTKAKKMLYIAIAILTLWLSQPITGIPIYISTGLGVLALILTDTLSLKEAFNQPTAIKVIIWLTIFIIASHQLKLSGFVTWLVSAYRANFMVNNNPFNLLLLAITLYFAHYLFASSAAYISALFTSALALGIQMGLEPLFATVAFAVITNLSGGVTNYSTGPAPMYFAKGYFSQTRWFIYSGSLALMVTVIYCSVMIAQNIV